MSEADADRTALHRLVTVKMMPESRRNSKEIVWAARRPLEGAQTDDGNAPMREVVRANR